MNFDQKLKEKLKQNMEFWNEEITEYIKYNWNEDKSQWQIKNNQ